MSTEYNFIDEIIGYLPKHAKKDVINRDGEDITLTTYWALNSDSERPHKQSKTLAISISRELIKDFPGYPEANRDAAWVKFKGLIAEKFAKYDPEHEEKPMTQPPVEQWHISNSDLF